MPGERVVSEDDRNQPARPPTSAVEMRTGRMSTVGVPTEKSRDFAASSARLLARLRPERMKVLLVVFLAVASVALLVIGPKVLGHATNLLFEGLVRRAQGGPGVDFGALHRTLWLAVGLYIVGSWLAFTQAYLVAGVVQRTMFRLREDAEAKMHTMPLTYVDSQPRGDLLSRVTNDIDNVSQSMQQSISQLLTGLLTIIGVLIMMLTISWQLAIVAIVTIPVSAGMMRFIAGKSRGKFIAQWGHTGALNSQVEETFTGHAIVKAFGRQAEARERFDETNEQLYEAAFSAQFLSGCVQPATVLAGQPQLCGHRRLRRSEGGQRVARPRRRAGVHPVLAPVQHAAQPGGLDDERDAVGYRFGREGVRPSRCPRAERRPGGGDAHRGRPRRPRPGRVPRRLVPLPRGHARSSSTSRSPSSPARRWRSSAPPALARPPW